MYICIIRVFTYMNFTFFVSNAIDMLHKVARKKKKKKTVFLLFLLKPLLLQQRVEQLKIQFCTVDDAKLSLTDSIKSRRLSSH